LLNVADAGSCAELAVGGEDHAERNAPTFA
jgi:hypothetical protein